MIKYLGSKRQLIPWIVKTIKENFEHIDSALDVFSGTSRVSLALKEQGIQVHANDHNTFAFHIANCYVATNKEELPKNIEKIIEHLNSLPPKAGFFTENYCLKARFFHPKNGEKVDAIRNEIDKLDLSQKIRSVLLVSLMEAADRTDSTCGIQMAYLKSWAKRAHNDLSLRIPNLISDEIAKKDNQAYCLDAIEAAKTIKCDLAYLDPPYNQHSYRSNYHIWETLVQWDNPTMYGQVQKRMDCREIKSDFNSKKKFKLTLETLISSLQTKYLVLSFSNEGFINKEELENMLNPWGSVKVFSVEYKRYVGAQIGIYNQQGLKVGNVKNLHNQEFLYVARRF